MFVRSALLAYLPKMHKGERKIKEKLRAFEKQLTRKEWDDVYGKRYFEDDQTHCKHIENIFSKYWSLKEVRARHFVLIIYVFESTVLYY